MKPKVKDFYERFFGGYLNWAILRIKEIAVISILSALLNFKDIRTKDIKDSEKGNER